MAAIGGETMPRTWIEITAADCAAAVSNPSQWWAAVHSNLEYLKAAAYGLGSYVGAYPHSHRGAEDAPIVQARAFNLLINSAPGVGFGLWGGGATVAGDWKFDRKVTKVTTSGFLFNGVEGAFAAQWCPMKGAQDEGSTDTTVTKFYDICKCIYGGDGRITVSGYAKLVDDVPTQGEFGFGMTDGDSEFLEGCQAPIHFSDLSTSWKRFYSFITVRDIRDGARFAVAQTAAQDAATYITALQVSPGHRLTYWEPCRLDKCRSGEEHYNWTGYGIATVPLWEKATSITNAVKLEAF